MPRHSGTVPGPSSQWNQQPRTQHSPLRTRILAVGDSHLSQVIKHSSFQSPLVAIITEASNVGACRKGSMAETRGPGITGPPLGKARGTSPFLAKATFREARGMRAAGNLPLSAESTEHPTPPSCLFPAHFLLVNGPLSTQTALPGAWRQPDHCFLPLPPTHKLGRLDYLSWAPPLLSSPALPGLRAASLPWQVS